MQILKAKQKRMLEQLNRKQNELLGWDGGSRK
jgi:hypothetical protein